MQQLNDFLLWLPWKSKSFCWHLLIWLEGSGRSSQDSTQKDTVHRLVILHSLRNLKCLFSLIISGCSESATKWILYFGSMDEVHISKECTEYIMIISTGMMHTMDHDTVNMQLAKLLTSEGLDVQLGYDGLQVPIDL